MKEIKRRGAQVPLASEESITESFPMMLILVLFFVITFCTFILFPAAESFAQKFI